MEGDVGDLGRQREDDVEVADRKQVRLALGQPDPCCCTLTLGAMPVTTAVVSDPPMPAVLASLDMAAHGSTAAGLNRRHHLQLSKAQMPDMGGPVIWACSSEDVGDLQ